MITIISVNITGRIANKQLKSHFRAYEAMSLDPHFEERDLKFKQQELDPVTGECHGEERRGEERRRRKSGGGNDREVD